MKIDRRTYVLGPCGFCSIVAEETEKHSKIERKQMDEMHYPTECRVADENYIFDTEIRPLLMVTEQIKGLAIARLAFRRKTRLVHNRAGRLRTLARNVTGTCPPSRSVLATKISASRSPDVSGRCEGTQYKNSSYRSNVA